MTKITDVQNRYKKEAKRLIRATSIATALKKIIVILPQTILYFGCTNIIFVDCITALFEIISGIKKVTLPPGIKHV